MDWTRIYLDTFIPELPKHWNNSFEAFQRNMDVFYDASRGILIKPLETTGRIKGARGEFVTAVVDNLIVKSQFTNLYENITTADSDFVNYYNGSDVSTRISSSPVPVEDVSIWPYEPSAYSWVDVQTAYIKINNDSSYGFQNNNLGQEFRLLFDLDVSTDSPYTILMESSLGGSVNLSVDSADASACWIKMITVEYDNSTGPVWVVKEYGGTYTIS